MGDEVLSVEEVRKRLDEYHEGETTTELYNFGAGLVQEGIKRSDRLDSKATMVIGYVSAIAALLIGLPNWLKEYNSLAKAFVFFAVVFSLGAGAVAFRALRVRDLDWFSDMEWFRQELLDYPDRLKRYHILAMHRVVMDRDRINSIKADAVFRSQNILAWAFVSLIAALVMGIL